MLWRDERVRFGAGVVGVVIVLATAGVVLVFGLGTLKWLVRDSAPTLMGWPGGPWVVGGGFGLVTVFGALGGLWFAPDFLVPGAAGARRGFRIAGAGLCWVVACCSGMYLWNAFYPGKFCRSGPSCEYIPGTGSAFLSYAITAGVIGWLVHRWRAARAEERRLRERERIRKLRKKGKGKSRAAARRG
ncbi:hypothetical protein [Streptomyces yerevanensis]|uniref:hypothetical protein n=1 Tax=Streptomyces yerevanensis TaxID=66378 RepID=UPI00068C6249|nr:hypothetical protein [Streptomyces yerevanensis]